MPRSAPYGFTRTVLNFSIPFTTFLSATGQVTLVLSKSLGFAGVIEKVEIAPTTVGTGAGANRVINVRKGNATGTIIATVTATLANQGTLGVVTVGTVTTADAANAFTDADTLTIELPTAGAVVFTAGALELLITVRQLAQRAK